MAHMNLKQFLALTALSVFLPAPVLALESDRDQPAVIDAESVDIDFATGKRVYKGNVKLRQGTIKLDADKVEVYFKNGELEKAIAKGNPAVFSQRPDGKPHDVVGKAIFIHLDEINNVITLTKNAILTQGQDSISGKTIVYDMANDKMKVRGGGQSAPTRSTKMPETETPNAAAGAGSMQETGEDGRRPKIVLKPKPTE